MMLADQASQKSPIHKGGGGGGASNQEEDAHFNFGTGSFERRVLDVLYFIDQL